MPEICTCEIAYVNKLGIINPSELAHVLVLVKEIPDKYVKNRFPESLLSACSDVNV